MKKYALIFITALIANTLFAQNLTGYDIMKKAEETEEAKTSSYTATMTITNKKGNVRVREVIMKSKDFGDNTKTVIVFVSPKDVSGISYLMIDYDEKEDGTKKDSDTRLYMPKSKRTIRITGSDSGGDFMGTDFTTEDMGERGLNKDTFTLLGEETVNGTDCYKVEAVSKDKTEKNPRRISWISKDNFLLIKCEFFDRQDALQRVLTCSGFEKINGYWATKTMLMENVQSSHSTVLETKNISYNENIDDNLFTVAALERGLIK